MSNPSQASPAKHSRRRRTNRAPAPAPNHEPSPGDVVLWRLPLAGRLHADRDCRLLKLETSLPSPMNYHASLLERCENRPRRETRTLPIATGAIPHLCACARHLLG
jgi:hypothetical protein